MQDKFFSLVLILLPLSFISERITNILKLWYIFKLEQYEEKESDSEEEKDRKRKMRERRVLLISIISGLLVALVLKADLFSIFKDADQLGWANFKGNVIDGLWVVIGCCMTAIFLSWGSKFWHDMLDILVYTKMVRKAFGKKEAMEVRKNEMAYENEKSSMVSATITSHSDASITPEEAEEASIEGEKKEEEKDTVDKEETPALPALPQDNITLKRIERLHPKIRQEAKDIYNEILERRVTVRFTSTLRTIAEQNALYAKGRTKPGSKVTNAKGGQSYHNYGLAIDFVLLLDGGKRVSWDRKLDMDEDKIRDWEEVVHVFKEYGWEWGGDWRNFKDYPHFQKTFGKRTSELFKLHNDKKVDAEGYVTL